MGRLHNAMRRNYAAALQDGAQQMMNSMLKTGLTNEVLDGDNPAEIYKDYPLWLGRASDLLGQGHYIYPILQARKHFFEGKEPGHENLYSKIKKLYKDPSVTGLLIYSPIAKAADQKSIFSAFVIRFNYWLGILRLVKFLNENLLLLV